MYFPDNAFSDFVRDWYSRALKAADEPSLWQMSQEATGEVYRFTYLRTFHQPVFVRVDFTDPEKPAALLKILDGMGGYESGAMFEERNLELTQEQAQAFLQTLNRIGFWELPLKGDQIGLDGAQWIIEGISKGRYHVIVRWSPEEGPVRDLGLAFLDLAEVHLSKIY